MIRLRHAVLAGSALALATTAANAQSRSASIPPGQMPPAGMCRVWIDGVPPGQQPAATDCVTARRNAPANSRVIYGASANGRYEVPRGDARYDERLDPRSPRYDAVYAARVRNGSYRNTDQMTREERMRYEAQLRETARLQNEARAREAQRARELARLREQERLRSEVRVSHDVEKQNRELQKAERKSAEEMAKVERKRNKEYEKARKHDGDKHDGDKHDRDKH